MSVNGVRCYIFIYVYEPLFLRLSNKRAPFFEFYLEVFRQAGVPRRAGGNGKQTLRIFPQKTLLIREAKAAFRFST